MNEKRVSKTSLGSSVKVTGFTPGEGDVFHLVPEGQVNYAENKIPSNSPLATALEGTNEGDTVLFHPPAGRVELTVSAVKHR
ncbi:MAG: GreA/GreB family elongation factor [Pirellulales bacterium]|nr:GreA/GreB family elongation factor [Pirellulales bacterium]